MHQSEIKRLTSMRDYNKRMRDTAKARLAETPNHNVLGADFWRKRVIEYDEFVKSLNRQLGRHA